jgi:hypothetical protein
LSSITFSCHVSEWNLSPVTPVRAVKRAHPTASKKERRNTVNAAGIIVVFVLGAMVAGILGFILQRIQYARGRAGAYRRPQAIVQQTSQTPIQVVRSSVAAGFSCLFWTIVLVLFLGLLGYVAYYAVF